MLLGIVNMNRIRLISLKCIFPTRNLSRIAVHQFTTLDNNKHLKPQNKQMLQNFQTLFKCPMSFEAEKKLVVQHDVKGGKFFIKLGYDIAKLQYGKKGDVLNMYSTTVPKALQGKGIAKILAEEAFAYAVKNGLKMKLTCSYLQKYYKENPKEEYKSLVLP